MIRAPASATRVALAAVLVLGAGSCGDNAGGFDGGPPIDARHFGDAAVVSCGADPAETGRGDAGAGRDAGSETADAGMAGGTCDGEERRTVCDIDRRVCVECLATADCQLDSALGPRCDEESGTCICSGDDACAGNANGPYCHAIVRACTCLLDRDCERPATCELEPYLGAGIRTCRDPGSIARARRAQTLRSVGPATDRSGGTRPSSDPRSHAKRLSSSRPGD